ncbi:hypothetical protein HK405_012771 [Cladochytrium tenue]|nr:hypothetical protein HK405_012771 [Cladochytrium tenue]
MQAIHGESHLHRNVSTSSSSSAHSFAMSLASSVASSSSSSSASPPGSVGHSQQQQQQYQPSPQTHSFPQPNTHAQARNLHGLSFISSRNNLTSSRLTSVSSVSAFVPATRFLTVPNWPVDRDLADFFHLLKTRQPGFNRLIVNDNGSCYISFSSDETASHALEYLRQAISPYADFTPPDFLDTPRPEAPLPTSNSLLFPVHSSNPLVHPSTLERILSHYDGFFSLRSSSDTGVKGFVALFSDTSSASRAFADIFAYTNVPVEYLRKDDDGRSSVDFGDRWGETFLDTASVSSFTSTSSFANHMRVRTIYVTSLGNKDKADIRAFCSTLPGFYRVQFGQTNFRVVLTDPDRALEAMAIIQSTFKNMKATFARKEPEVKIIEELGEPSRVLWTSTLYWSEPEFRKYMQTYEGFEKVIFDAAHSWVHFRDVECARRALEDLNYTTNLYSVFSKKYDRDGTTVMAQPARSSRASTPGPGGSGTPTMSPAKPPDFDMYQPLHSQPSLKPLTPGIQPADLVLGRPLPLPQSLVDTANRPPLGPGGSGGVAHPTNRAASPQLVGLLMEKLQGSPRGTGAPVGSALGRGQSGLRRMASYSGFASSMSVSSSAPSSPSPFSGRLLEPSRMGVGVTAFGPSDNTGGLDGLGATASPAVGPVFPPGLSIGDDPALLRLPSTFDDMSLSVGSAGLGRGRDAPQDYGVQSNIVIARNIAELTVEECRSILQSFSGFDSYLAGRFGAEQAPSLVVRFSDVPSAHAFFEHPHIRYLLGRGGGGVELSYASEWDVPEAWRGTLVVAPAPPEVGMSDAAAAASVIADISGNMRSLSSGSGQFPTAIGRLIRPPPVGSPSGESRGASALAPPLSATSAAAPGTPGTPTAVAASPLLSWALPTAFASPWSPGQDAGGSPPPGGPGAPGGGWPLSRSGSNAGAGGGADWGAAPGGTADTGGLPLGRRAPGGGMFPLGGVSSRRERSVDSFRSEPGFTRSERWLDDVDEPLFPPLRAGQDYQVGMSSPLAAPPGFRAKRGGAGSGGVGNSGELAGLPTSPFPGTSGVRRGGSKRSGRAAVAITASWDSDESDDDDEDDNADGNGDHDGGDAGKDGGVDDAQPARGRPISAGRAERLAASLAGLSAFLASGASPPPPPPAPAPVAAAAEPRPELERESESEPQALKAEAIPAASSAPATSKAEVVEAAALLEAEPFSPLPLSAPVASAVVEGGSEAVREKPTEAQAVAASVSAVSGVQAAEKADGVDIGGDEDVAATVALLEELAGRARRVGALLKAGPLGGRGSGLDEVFVAEPAGDARDRKHHAAARGMVLARGLLDWMERAEASATAAETPSGGSGDANGAAGGAAA